jgi:stage III sporulation protein AA
MQSIHSTRHSPLLPPALSAVLPAPLREGIRLCGATQIEELRLHTNRYATVTSCGQNLSTGVILRGEEMQEILYKMCGGSLYAFSQTIFEGYLKMGNGIRVGVCGSAALEKGEIIGVSAVSGLIVRIPNSVSVDPAPVMSALHTFGGQGVLIYAPPGVGKTTLLRAVAKAAASPDFGMRTVVVDSREELCFSLEGEDLALDVLLGYPKAVGIGIAVRSMGAQLIICDEIGSEEDTDAILSAAACGVPLVASAHGGSIRELLSRPEIYRLHRGRVFGGYVALSRRKSGLVCSALSWSEADRQR